MAEDQTMIIGLIIVVFCCCCLSSLAAGGFMVTGTPSPAPAPGPSTSSSPSGPSTSSSPSGPSTSSLPSGSIKLINSETAFTSANQNVGVANQPKGPNGVDLSYNLQPVQYTISFRINNTGAAANGQWREILQNSPQSSWNGAIRQDANSPLFFLAPPDAGGIANKLCFRHLGSDSNNYEAQPASTLSFNTWHTVTAVADTNKLTIYIDSDVPVSKTLPSGVTLRYRNGTGPPTNVNQFVWNNVNPSTVPYSIKDAYWWPRALTASEVAQVHSTTSTYMPEPLTMGTSAYVKETYMPY